MAGNEAREGEAGGGVAVVIPCFRESESILGVLAAIGPETTRIYVVDDHCPEGTGDLVATRCSDPRLRILRHSAQRGVGAATVTGYRAALEDGADIIVKLDGDGQMDPALIPRLILPITQGEADYAKGNRFFRLHDLAGMPAIRVVGNSLLAFLTKFSSGYWDLFDPTNGFTAIHSSVAASLPLEKLSEGYFFESDMLFRLGTIRAVVAEVPMTAHYGGERSSLSVARAAVQFPLRHAVNFGKRIFYGYFLRSFSIASIELVFGLLMLAFGTGVGVYSWASAYQERFASAGTVMLAALPVMIGVQLLLAFLTYDMQNAPRKPLHRRL